jgi:hypothetical protein
LNIDIDKERFPDYEEIVSAKPLSQKEKFEKLNGLDKKCLLK